jgi:hypothetical protein
MMFLDHKKYLIYSLYIMIVSDQNVNTIELDSVIDFYDPYFPTMFNNKDLKMQDAYEDIELALLNKTAKDAKYKRKKRIRNSKKSKFKNVDKTQASLVKLV